MSHRYRKETRPSHQHRQRQRKNNDPRIYLSIHFPSTEQSSHSVISLQFSFLSHSVELVCGEDVLRIFQQVIVKDPDSFIVQEPWKNCVDEGHPAGLIGQVCRLCHVVRRFLNGRKVQSALLVITIHFVDFLQEGFGTCQLA